MSYKTFKTTTEAQAFVSCARLAGYVAALYVLATDRIEVRYSLSDGKVGGANPRRSGGDW